MKDLINNLEQPSFLSDSSQGEGILQNNSGVEEDLNELGSKKQGEEKNVSFENLENKDKLNKTDLEISNPKFKSVEELSKAYDNLQSDYTRKCQALASLQKEMEDNKEKSLPKVLNKSCQIDMKSFLENNLDAKGYEGEIAKIVLTDNNIATSDNPLQEAWNYYKLKNFISKKSLVENEDFLNSYILNNEKVKERILNEYFSLINLQSSPNLITSKSGSQTFLSKVEKPKSIEEAGKLVEDMF